jgi:hypothetical protein
MSKFFRLLIRSEVRAYMAGEHADRAAIPTLSRPGRARSCVTCSLISRENRGKTRPKSPSRKPASNIDYYNWTKGGARNSRDNEDTVTQRDNLSVPIPLVSRSVRRNPITSRAHYSLISCPAVHTQRKSGCCAPLLRDMVPHVRETNAKDIARKNDGMRGHIAFW